MRSPGHMTELDFEDMSVGSVYLSWYRKVPKILYGYFPFTVTKIPGRSVHIKFVYPVRRLRGIEAVKGDEPSILFQHPEHKTWTAYGATAVDVPVRVGKLE